jgi:signal transduction histidine kinase
LVADKQTILYIEDDPASRLLVERTLNFAGYHVLVAENGLDGLAMARKEAVDLVLTDINLPDISGREVTTRLRSDSRFDQTPIVALTAQALDEQRDMTMAAGITGYLTKPIDVEALPGQIKKYLMGAKDHIETERLSDAQVRYAQELVSRLEERIQDLETLNQTLRRLDKMKDSFIQLTAHELRTPLTLVYGYSRLLQDNPLIKATVENDENTRALLTGLVDAIERMQGIVNEILTISRIMTNQVTMSIGSVNPGHVAQKLVNEYENVLKNRLLTAHLDTSQPGWNVKLRADGDLLHLALASLFSNAIKYTPDNGNIYFLAQADEQHIRISVKDTGIGVAKEEQERIFDRFHTAGDVMLHSTSKTAFRGGGLGLGLAVCKSIVEAHGGTVWVESPGYDIDKLPGSEFIIKLPLVAISPTN